MERVKQVIIFGGTHGDEMSGVYLVNKWNAHPEILKKHLSSCPITPFIANPEAVKICRRYKDCDLNRQFSEENYSKVSAKSEPLPYEVKRASEIHDKFEENGNGKSLILDLHNTTSKMNLTMIVNDQNNGVSLHLVNFVQKKLGNDLCKVLSLGLSAYACTRSLTSYGCALEVGPQPQGVLRADICKLQEKALHYCLEFIQKFNDGVEFDGCEVTVFQILQKVPFPKSLRPGIDIMIHENVQDKDFGAINLKDPVFRTINDEVLTLQDALGDSLTTTKTLYTAFVNEASYYEKDLAFWLTTKETIAVPRLQAK